MKTITILIFNLIFIPMLYSQSLQNGGFENGYTGWTAYSQAGDNIVGTTAFFASTSITPQVNVRSGIYMARLGGFSYNINNLKQVVTLPVANPVKLEMYYQTRAATTSECAGIWVGAKVNIYISGTSIYENYLCNYNNVEQWTYGYFDLTQIAGQTVEIKLNAEAANSVWSYIYIDDLNISPSSTDIQSNDHNLASNLEQNYPNPFSETTSIKYTINNAAKTSLAVFNQYGQKVLTVFDEFKPKGEYTCNLCGLDLSDGIYYYQITSGDFTTTKKMIVAK